MLLAHHRVALLGFSAFERSAIGSYFRLAARRVPSYELVNDLDDGDFVLADAEHAPSVQLVVATERLADTVFVGGHEPPGALAWMPRPVDPMNVMRELDTLAARRAAPPPAKAPALSAAPAAVPAEPAAPPPPPARVAAAATAPVPAPTALVVDDSEIAREYLRHRLERWGVQVEFAEGSTRAIQWLSRRSFDFVFIDVELGAASSMDGLSLCHHIKRQHHALPGGPSLVVLVSAHQGELDRVRGTLAGADAYLGKPLDETQLAQLLRRQGLRLVAPAP